MTIAPATTTTFPATSAAFARALAKQPGGGASVSVTVDGREALTLVGGVARPGRPWEPDTRAVTMSVAKGWAGLVMAMLADRGRLDPDERVAHYWPEFAAAGKGDITVRQVLMHTSGVIGTPEISKVLRWDGRGWNDLDAIAAALAAAAPVWEPGTRTGYHIITYGWLLGELVRRTDGRTLGTFIREEVAEPLGIRTRIGVPADEQHDIATVVQDGMANPPLLMRRPMGRAQRMFRDPSTWLGLAALGDGTYSVFDNHQDFSNSPAWLAAEVPSSNGVTSARDLARLFAAVALGGELDGVRLLSESTLREWSTPYPGEPDAVMTSSFGPVLRRLVPGRTERSLGFLANTAGKGLGPGRASVGAAGYGGQLVFADPDRRLSFAFVRSALLWEQKSIGELVAAVYRDLG